MHKNDILKLVMNSALKAAMPKDKFKTLPLKPKGKLLVIGAGKAAASMAKEFEDSYNDGPIEGIVITRYEHSTKTKFIEVVEASHPEPDKIGLIASKKLFDLAKKADEDDHVIFLISGGASSLLTLPADGINFEEKQRINKELLISGAPIDQMNIVRRALSKIKGGRLAEAIYPAKLSTYMISDIPGDDPSYIGSGPTIQANGSNNDALKILNNYKIDISQNLKEIIIKNQLPKILNSPTYMLANPMMALKSAYDEAAKFGCKPIIISDSIEGEARVEAQKMADLAIKIKKEKKFKNIDLKQPILLLSGGETTVTVKGNGKGGRNTEFMLSMAIHLNEASGITALSIDSDGIDGVEDNAGAFISDVTLRKAKSKNLMPQKFLDNNDSYSFFQKIDDLIFTNPTLTNVNDFRAVLIEP
ncbi:glycerate kinase [Alphaproteobacteria bacterium]|nr:glycerate kinase [Alphaproteobacteria bacterium]